MSIKFLAPEATDTCFQKHYLKAFYSSKRLTNKLFTIGDSFDMIKINHNTHHFSGHNIGVTFSL